MSSLFEPTPFEYTGIDNPKWDRFRHGQLKAADLIRRWLDSNDLPNVLAIVAPAGMGKTLLAAVACHAHEPERSVILTPRKQLQKQMGDELGDDYPLLFGRSNYRCVEPSHGGRAQDDPPAPPVLPAPGRFPERPLPGDLRSGRAPCASRRGEWGEVAAAELPARLCDSYFVCPYYSTLGVVAEATHSVANYASWQAWRRLGRQQAVSVASLEDEADDEAPGVQSVSSAFSQVSLVVCDEAHMLQSVMTSFREYEVPGYMLTAHQLKDLWDWHPGSPCEWVCPPPPQVLGAEGKTEWSGRVADWVSWGDDLLYALEKVWQAAGGNSDPDAALEKLPGVYARLLRGARRLAFLDETRTAVTGITASGLSFAPVAPLLEDLADWRDGQKVLLLSATMSEDMLSFLGLEKGDYGFYEARTGWSPARSPVARWLPGSVNLCYWSRRVKGAPERAQAAWLSALAQRDGDNALFLANAHRDVGDAQWGVAGALERAGVPVAANLDSDSLPDAMSLHRSQGGVLASASVGVGYDFPDDAARVIVIAALTFPNFGDPLVRARIERWGYERWAYWEAIAAAQQMAGRGMRSEKDWVWTVCADSRWPWFLAETDRLQSRWFRERLTSYRPYGAFRTAIRVFDLCDCGDYPQIQAVLERLIGDRKLSAGR